MSEFSCFTVISSPRNEGKSLCFQAVGSGQPPEEGRFLLFPGSLPLRLKSLKREAGSPSVTLEVRGVSRTAVTKGTFLIPDEIPASEGQRALFLWKKKPGGQGAVDFDLRDKPGLISGGKGDLKGKDRLFYTDQPAGPFCRSPDASIL